MNKKRNVVKKSSVSNRPGSRPNLLPKGIRLLSYEITNEPITDNYQHLPPEIRGELEDIRAHFNRLHLLSKQKIVAIQQRLEKFAANHPKLPIISNYLACVYKLTKNPKLQDLIVQNYQNHPDYLFARIQYAEQLLISKDIAQFNEVFKEGFDLKLIYPSRNRFHVSEFISFSHLMVSYYLIINELKSAQTILHTMEQVAPNHNATKSSQRMVNLVSPS